MLLLVIITSSVLSLNNSATAAQPESQWSKTYTNSYGKGNSIIATTDGGYVIAGVSNTRFLLAKIDSSGEVIWWKTYQTGGATCVIQTSDGGFALAGSGDVNFIKTDSSGNVQWTKNFTEDEKALNINGMVQTSDGGYVLACDNSAWDWTLKIDPQGNIVWSKTYGTQRGQSWATDILQVNDGYILAANSKLYKLNENGDVQWSQSTSLASSLVKTTDGGYLVASASGPTLIKFGSEGSVEWSKAYSPPSSKKVGGSYPFFHSAIETQDGGFIAAGIEFPIYDGVAWIVKSDSAGNQEWSITSESFVGHNCNINSIIEVNSSVYMFAGGISSLMYSNYSEVWLAKVSTSILPASTNLIPESTTNSQTSPTPSSTIPEFSSLVLLPLFILMLSTAILFRKKKENYRFR